LIKRIVEYSMVIPFINYNRNKTVSRIPFVKEFGIRFMNKLFDRPLGDFIKIKFGFTEIRSTDGKDIELKMFADQDVEDGMDA